jgi:hypothetical protein
MEEGKLMNIKQKAEHNRVARNYVLELGLYPTANTYGVIRKVLEAKTIDEKLTALDYLLKTITDNKREDV